MTVAPWLRELGGGGMNSLQYVVLSLVLGAVAVWGSENWFWFVPPPDLSLPVFLLTIVFYAIAAACALSAVILTGVRGWPAAFLGGAIIGYLSEGVMVGTIYDAFPIHMVWTPLAWHALLTGGVVFGLGRAGWPVGKLVLLWLAYGLFGAYWGQYWPLEHQVLPGVAELGIYLVAAGLLVGGAQLVLDRSGALPRPPLRVLLLAPGLVGLLWLWQTVAGFAPQRLALPLVLLLILWIMRRLGLRSEGGTSLGQSGGWRHGLFLIAPLVAVAVAPPLWGQEMGTLAANWVTLVATSLAALAALGWLIWRAGRSA